MSRIGNRLIPVPKGVQLNIDGTHIRVTGSKGSLERMIRPEVSLQLEDGMLSVVRKDNSKRTGAFSGLTRTLVSNMIVGVDTGFQKKLAIEGVGYRAEVKGDLLSLSVGYSNQVQFDLPKGVTAEVDKANNVTLSCIDKELLGETAAKIRAIRPPEPYKGKGIRYADEFIVRKAGKSSGKK